MFAATLNRTFIEVMVLGLPPFGRALNLFDIAAADFQGFHHAGLITDEEHNWLR